MKEHLYGFILGMVIFTDEVQLLRLPRPNSSIARTRNWYILPEVSPFSSTSVLSKGPSWRRTYMKYF